MIDNTKNQKPPQLAQNGVLFLDNNIKSGGRKHKEFILGRSYRDITHMVKKHIGVTDWKRVGFCGRKAIQGKEIVSLKKGESGHNFFSGVQLCSSWWTCPTCSAKYEKIKQNEVSDILQNATKEGSSLVVATLTIPHYNSMSGKKTVNDVKNIWRSITSKTAFKRMNSTSTTNYKKGKISDDFIKGYVSSFECTWGNNGFHPHYHIVFMCDNSVALCDYFSDWLQNEWLKECKKITGRTAEKFTQTINNYSNATLTKKFEEKTTKNEKASKVGQLTDYLTKLGLSYEMTSPKSKDFFEHLKNKKPLEVIKSIKNENKDQKIQKTVSFYGFALRSAILDSCLKTIVKEYQNGTVINTNLRSELEYFAMDYIKKFKAFQIEYSKSIKGKTRIYYSKGAKSFIESDLYLANYKIATGTEKKLKQYAKDWLLPSGSWFIKDSKGVVKDEEIIKEEKSVYEFLQIESKGFINLVDSGLNVLMLDKLEVFEKEEEDLKGIKNLYYELVQDKFNAWLIDYISRDFSIYTYEFVQIDNILRLKIEKKEGVKVHFDNNELINNFENNLN